MKRYVLLSWEIGAETPLYPGTPSVKVIGERVIANGDSCNTTVITLSSHTGTHVDLPRHFFADGRAITNFTAGEFCFHNPIIVDCPKKDGEAITSEELMDRFVGEPDLLLLRTGFERYRTIERERYVSKSPILDPSAATWLRSNCPTLRGIGLDTISVASPAAREAGRATHRILLGEKREYRSKPLLIIEDMRLSAAPTGLEEVIVAPLMLRDGDGAPATVFGVLDD